MKQKLQRKLVWAGLIVIMVSLVFGPIPIARAAQATSFSDVLSRLKDSTVANHEIKFVTPTGVQDTNDTITLLMTGFNAASVDAIVAADVDFAVGDSSNCTTASFTEKTVSGTTGSGATYGFDTNGSNLMTLDPGTDTFAGNLCVRFRVGTNAVTGGTGTHQITNGTAATAHSVTLGGVFGDSGVLAIDIITDDQVSISATVDPTITFTIDDNAVGFGTLSSSTGRWATADATGANASAGVNPTVANVLTIATNAASGYSVTYSGDTLKSGTPSIDVATVAGDSDGTPGTEEFGLSVSTSGDATIASGYQRDTTADFKLIANTTTTIVSETVPTNTETLSVSYLANIGGATEAGSYSTTLTYIATGTF